ncbi:DUF6370 family protein [Tundrisphaera sp. TA3]|uniref:DUF6370 family protein n=1 Tax=Tundrisphaera sp. TA3 TaxID=3435775 RepID=UPI003EB6A156
MRKLIPFLSVAALFTGIALAADPVTITGEGKCGKCALSETPTCQNVIEVEEGGKTVKYYLAQNPTAKAYHGKVCKATVKTTATGTVEEKDGKKVMTATKIEAAK